MNNLSHVFWGEIVPANHFLQVYESEDEFLDSLEAYVCSGFVNGDGVVVIATESHLKSLDERLERTCNLEKLKAINQFIPLEAETVLERMLVNDNIDESLFAKTVERLLTAVHKQKGGIIRVFGEIVALLWDQGNRQAVLKLERLWEELCSTGSICLFCAYPKSGFRHDAIKPLTHICAYHNNLIEKKYVRF